MPPGPSACLAALHTCCPRAVVEQGLMTAYFVGGFSTSMLQSVKMVEISPADCIFLRGNLW